MRKNRKLSLKSLFLLVCVAALLIKLWPTFVVLAEAANMYVTSVTKRAAMNQQLEKINASHGWKMLPDGGIKYPMDYEVGDTRLTAVSR